MALHSLMTGLAGVFFMTLALAQADSAALAPEKLDPNFSVTQPGSDLRWYSALQLRRSSAGWPVNELAKPWDRLPARAEKMVRPEVWSLSRHSAGIEINFSTDASEIGARWTLINPGLAMDHMPATGMSGLDLYVRHEGRWQWLGVGRPTESPSNLVKLASVPAGGGMRDYRLYLPLYNGIEDLQIGVPASAKLAAMAPLSAQTVVVYGTSITQGGCASRPGMAYPAILGRKFNLPVINLGFSGNGNAEIVAADLVSELNPSVFILDPLPNMTPLQIAGRIEPFVARLRTRHPRIPIILLGNISYQQAGLGPLNQTDHAVKNAILAPIVARLMTKDDRLFFVPGDSLLGQDGEATVDGTHPTDLGFLRMAEAISPSLKKALDLSR
ncbi:SGNH/GDSL hydrolase family protein [Paucibacter sp. Y2R2-4]|uniref:SGNH/GDSL hydrolase family protein n=1 Tax=Paucibacter sp. Y2R2-4 TaxID=2893553 RepID=UPI0021E42D06|nr:SGNH/GDSL hydrolase family protein [Paucibacter sp. Y2R2-4]MCV2349166.1 SGNH/GDSL hydrolase family protein [Paucibacter sp. Y2R2-4]